MISKDEILERTNRGLDVFKYYLGIPFKPGKTLGIPYMKTKTLRAISILTNIQRRLK